MSDGTSNNICREHSGLCSDMETVKDNVSKLWEKWDSMQKMVTGIFIALCFNLLGVIFILIRTL